MLRLQTESRTSRRFALDSNSASFRNSRLLLEFLAVMLSQLRNLRLDHYTAVGLPGVLCVIILMIVFRLVELAIWHNLGDYRFLPDFRVVKLLNHLTCSFLLIWVVIEYRRAILGSHIASLAIVGRGVMSCEEYL